MWFEGERVIQIFLRVNQNIESWFKGENKVKEKSTNQRLKTNILIKLKTGKVVMSKTSGLVGGVGFSKLPSYSFYYINKTLENRRHLRLGLWFSIKAASLTAHGFSCGCWSPKTSTDWRPRPARWGRSPCGSLTELPSSVQDRSVWDWNRRGFHGRRSESQELAWKRKRTFYCERVCAAAAEF